MRADVARKQSYFGHAIQTALPGLGILMADLGAEPHHSTRRAERLLLPSLYHKSATHCPILGPCPRYLFENHAGWINDVN